MASDLILLAVRYVAGDLPDDEAVAFETRLANDQGAREAVARAVELAGAIAQLPPATPDLLPLPPARPRVRLSSTIAAAACLALAVGVLLRWPRDVPPSTAAAPIVATPSHPEAVALAWSGIRQSGEIDLVSHSELVAWLDEPAGVPGLDLLASETAATEDDGLPAWLLEATSLRESSSSQAGSTEN